MKEVASIEMNGRNETAQGKGADQGELANMLQPVVKGEEIVDACESMLAVLPFARLIPTGGKPMHPETVDALLTWGEGLLVKAIHAGKRVETDLGAWVGSWQDGYYHIAFVPNERTLEFCKGWAQECAGQEQAAKEKAGQEQAAKEKAGTEEAVKDKAGHGQDCYVGQG